MEFRARYSRCSRPSIPPEKLLRALLLQALYSVRSIRLLLEQLQDNLLYRRFVRLALDDPVWDHSGFSKNQGRLLAAELTAAFCSRILAPAREASLWSDEHLTVDGTLIEAWASLNSFRPKDTPLSSGAGGATRQSTFTVSVVAMRRTPRRPTQKPSFFARSRAKRLEAVSKPPNRGSPSEACNYI